MKILLKYGILLIITILCFYGNAQNLDVDSVFVIEELPPLDPEFNHIQPPYRFSVYEIERQNNDTLPYMFVEEMPEFPGGIDSLKAFLAREIQYPSVAKNNGITGTVLVEFVVEKDGRVTNGKVKVPLFPECDKEAVRAVMSLPKWKPGKNMGKPVRCYYLVPVTFRP